MLYGIENFVILVFSVVITIRIEFHYAVFVHDHMLLLHQQHIRRAKTGDAVKAVRPLRPADYAPEQTLVSVKVWAFFLYVGLLRSQTLKFV